MSTDPALEDAHQRYQGFRDAAFHMTWEELGPKLPHGCDLMIKGIDEEALLFAEFFIQEGRFYRNGGGFDWGGIWRQMRSTPRRFDIAVWNNGVLCGLAAGAASRGKQNVTLKWMERFTDQLQLPLKGQFATTVFNAADHYAKIVGAQRLMVRDPLAGTERLYQAHGFSLAPRIAGVAYYVREVR